MKVLSGKVDFRNDSYGHLNSMVAKLSFTEDQFAENLDAYLKMIASKKSAKFKGTFYQAAYIKSTEGPSFRLAMNMIDPALEHYFMNELDHYKALDFWTMFHPKKEYYENQKTEDDLFEGYQMSNLA